jgi:hypothetical protein
MIRTFFQPFWKMFDSYMEWSVPFERYKDNVVEYFHAKSVATLLFMSFILLTAVVIANLFGSTEFYGSSFNIFLTFLGYLIAFLLIRRYSAR